jgi:CRISPR-associated protein Cst2
MAKQTTHIAGTFLIEASASFLNGAGLGDGENRNVTIPKTFRDGGYRVPYVSAQAWKRWLRNTLIEETGWPASELKQIGELSKRGTTAKIGGEFNPVEFPEDDIFGYMRAEKGQGKKKDEDEEEGKEDEGEETKQSSKTRALIRASPFAASILMSLKRTGVLSKDEGFVHLKEGTPLPYTTEFYNTHLQGVFCLNVGRLGVFKNIGDRIELDDSKIADWIRSGKIKVTHEEKAGKVYELTDSKLRATRGAAVLRALARLRGGAKQAAFGTDVSPKVLVSAGLCCGNPAFNSIFIDDGNGPQLKVETLQEIVRDYSDRITTNVYIGLRKGYFKNEAEVMKLSGTQEKGVILVVTTPIDAAEQMAKTLG